MISKKYNIDESHDISHSMDVLHFANDIYEQQVYLYPPLKNYKNVIQICALLHDMCDKKYMDEKTGSQEIFSYLEPRIESRENLLINKIITTMSYSKVKKDGFPVFENMDHYWAYQGCMSPKQHDHTSSMQNTHSYIAESAIYTYISKYLLS